MNNVVPESGPAFEAMMRDIDSEFIRDGLPIPSRPICAIMAVGRRSKISMPLVPSSARIPIELHHAQLSRNIHDWYKAVYGDRINIDFSPGKTVVIVEGDLYRLSLPRIYGTAQFVVVRQFLEQESTFTRGPATCNVLQLIESLTPAKANSLSDETLKDIFDKFVSALEAHDILEASGDHRLIQIARGDIQTAVTNLMDGTRFGESKWASLQAAEKILKAAIELQGSKFKFGHELAPHCQQLVSLGIVFDWAQLIRSIQCSAKIRYGDEECTKEEALSAHQASLALVVKLKDAGVKFKRGLG